MIESASRPLLIASLVLNVLVTLPAVACLLASSAVRSVVYQDILAPRLGRPDVVFIGDSLTQNAGIWGYRIGHYGFDTWNLAQSGMTTRQILQWQGRRAAELRPAFAFVMAGINDEDKTVAGADASFGYYRELLQLLQQSGIEPIIQLTLYRQNDPATAFIDRLNGRLVEYAAQNGLSIIDMNRTFSRDKSLLPEYSLDGTHLTPLAYRLWAVEVREVLARKKK